MQGQLLFDQEVLPQACPFCLGIQVARWGVSYAINQKLFSLVPERLREGVRLEVKVEEGQRSLQKQIVDLRTLMLWGFGVLFSGMGILIGLVMWDRLTAISPVVKKTRELEDKSDRVEKVLKELAKEDPKIEQALKRAGLL